MSHEKYFGVYTATFACSVERLTPPNLYVSHHNVQSSSITHGPPHGAPHLNPIPPLTLRHPQPQPCQPPFASITLAPSIMTVPISLILQYLEFWDIHTLRLTNQYFASITSPLPQNQNQTKFLGDFAFADTSYWGEEEFNWSRLAIMSNVYFSLWHARSKSPYIGTTHWRARGASS